MISAEVLADGFERVRQRVHQVLDGLDAEALTARLDPEANSIAWLVWHLTRVQDDHVAGVAGTEQSWTADGWEGRFDLPFPRDAIGYGHSSAEVGQVRVDSAGLLGDYYDAVHERTVGYLRTLSAEDLDEVVDEHWSPPVTRGVRLISVLCDDVEHIGQADFVRGVLGRRT